jgi:hypothetical protein
MCWLGVRDDSATGPSAPRERVAFSPFAPGTVRPAAPSPQDFHRAPTLLRRPIESRPTARGNPLHALARLDRSLRDLWRIPMAFPLAPSSQRRPSEQPRTLQRSRLTAGILRVRHLLSWFVKALSQRDGVCECADDTEKRRKRGTSSNPTVPDDDR